MVTSICLRIVYEGFPDGSVVKNLPAVLEVLVRSLSQEDPPEKEMVTHSSILVWEISWMSCQGRHGTAIVHGVTKSWT